MRVLMVQALSESPNSADIEEALRTMGCEVEAYPDILQMPNFLSEETVNQLCVYVKEHRTEIIFSIYFVMNAALAAYRSGIRYLSLIWDAPYTDVYNPLSRVDNVWITTFDKLDRERFVENGMPHVLYQPLAINKSRVQQWNQEIQETLQGKYMHEISFVGRLYADNLYQRLLKDIPVQMQYYFDSIVNEALFRWNGTNQIFGKVSEGILDCVRLMNPNFFIPNNQEMSDTRFFEILGLTREAARLERIALLNLLAKEHSVVLYTTDYQAAKENLEGVTIGPPVKYGKATSLVYAGSKINLSISLKGIEGGTPLRIMDIMGAGGFIMTTYCEETAELFEENQEIVMFRTPEELLEKVDYYLAHDREREQIARRGQEKVMERYTYEKKMKELAAWVTEEAQCGYGGEKEKLRGREDEKG